MDIQLPAPELGVPVRVIGDGAIATVNVADGRLLPAILFDSTSRPDLRDMIVAHRDAIVPGDVRTVWGSGAGIGRGEIDLILEFIKPVRTVAVLRFSIIEYGGIIDQIIRTGGMYLVAGDATDRAVTKILQGAPHLIVDVRAEFPRWESLLRDTLFRDGRTKGLKKEAAKNYANSVMKKWREVTDMRMGRGSAAEPSNESQ